MHFVVCRSLCASINLFLLWWNLPHIYSESIFLLLYYCYLLRFSPHNASSSVLWLIHHLLIFILPSFFPSFTFSSCLHSLYTLWISTELFSLFFYRLIFHSPEMATLICFFPSILILFSLTLSPSFRNSCVRPILLWLSHHSSHVISLLTSKQFIVLFSPSIPSISISLSLSRCSPLFISWLLCHSPLHSPHFVTFIPVIYCPPFRLTLSFSFHSSRHRGGHGNRSIFMPVPSHCGQVPGQVPGGFSSRVILVLVQRPVEGGREWWGQVWALDWFLWEYFDS